MSTSAVFHPSYVTSMQTAKTMTDLISVLVKMDSLVMAKRAKVISSKTSQDAMRYQSVRIQSMLQFKIQCPVL